MSMLQPSPAALVSMPRHASAEAYAAFVRQRLDGDRSLAYCLGTRARFVRRYPDLRAWFAAPLPERVGRLYGSSRCHLPGKVSYQARPYLYFLALRGDARFDWEWLLTIPKLHIWELLAGTELHAGAGHLIDDARRLGYHRVSATRAIGWTVSRIFLHTGVTRIEAIRDEDWGGLAEAVRRFAERDDVALYFGSAERYRTNARKTYLTDLHLLQVVLYHRGLTSLAPRKTHLPGPPRPVLKPRMEAVVERYLAARRLTHRPATVYRLGHAVRTFIIWLAAAHPQVESFADVTREHVLAFAEALAQHTVPHTGRPLAALTRRGCLACLAVFFREVAAWGWDDVPTRPLLGPGDLPTMPARVPRFIPEDELARLMAAIRQLSCPYQRTALLVARWSGARRDEIRRLEVDCLDAYPDGTPRLRIPVGKLKRERLVPLNEEAAAAIRTLQADRRGERGFRDDLTGVETRYLFMHHGKLFAAYYLFDRPLRTACLAAGLVDGTGKPTVTAHRFRHTVGTQLAERGAKLHTIMSVLGHTSVNMSLVYAQISDQEVLRDYQAVLGPGATRSVRKLHPALRGAAAREGAAALGSGHLCIKQPARARARPLQAGW